jgi:hypothetical protein
LEMVNNTWVGGDDGVGIGQSPKADTIYLRGRQFQQAKHRGVANQTEMYRGLWLAGRVNSLFHTLIP